jgi:hypothetical protein
VLTWIWRRNIILVSLAAQVLFACLPSQESVGADQPPLATPFPQTPKSNMDYPSDACRIREEIPIENAKTLSLPELDVQDLLYQDQNLPKDAPLRNATSSEVNVDPVADGQWEKTEEGTQVWRLRIISPQALSLSLGFTAFNMPAQGCLFVYSPDHNQVLGPYTRDDNAEHGQLWTPTVDGEEVILEVSVPQDQFSRLQLVLGFINQGYRQ